MYKTTDIVEQWFKRQHEDVIDKLKKEPEMQLAYLLQVLNERESEIESIFLIIIIYYIIRYI